MFNEKSCGNCIKSWSKCFMWICAFLICLGGIIKIFQITAEAKEKVQSLQAECEWVLSTPRKGEEIRQTRLDYDLKIGTVRKTAIRFIILILIGVVGAIFINRFFWGMCFGFGIITHSQSGNIKECDLKKESQNPEFDENLLKYTK